nr:hypothetical protein BaRGS_032338 [Batillaria attramentaria]
MVERWTPNARVVTKMALTGNSTVVDSEYAYPQPVAIAIGVITSLIGIATIVFNLFTLLAFGLRKTLRNFGDHFILNLALADMAIGVLSIPPYIPYLLTGRWTAGYAYCKFWLLWDYITPAASTFSMCVISLDRSVR